MQSLSRGTFMRAFAATAFVLLLINAGMAGLAVQRLIEGDRWVVHTYEVLDGLDYLNAQLREAEANHRNFIITGDASYLDAYRPAVPVVWQRLERLQGLTRDNPAQQQRIGELRSLFTGRLDRLQAVVEQRQNKGFEAARDLIADGTGVRLTNSIAQLTDAMKKEELNLLAARRKDARRSALNTYLALGVASIFALLFLIATLYFLALERKSRKGAEQFSQRLRWALQAAHGGAWDWDLKTRDAWWSPEMYQIWGVAPGSPQNEETSLAMVDERDRDNLQLALKSAVHDRIDGAYEFRISNPQKGLRWMATFARTLYDDDGSPQRMLGVTLDITERKDAEEHAEQSKRLLELFVEHAPASVAMFDRDMKYLMASRKWREECGVNEDEQIIGRCHYDLFPDMPAHWREVHRRGLAGESLMSEDDWTALDGKPHTIRWEVHPWGESKHENSGILILFDDITERRRTERELRESEQSLRSIFENAAVGVAQLSLGGTFLLVNHRFADQLGYRPEDMKGMNFRDITHPGDLAEEEQLFSALARGERDFYCIEKRNLRKDGRAIWARLTRSVVLGPDGKPEYLVAIVEDITARQLAEMTRDQMLAQLTVSESRFRAIYDNASVGIEQVSVDGRLLMVNASLCKLLDYTEAQLRAKTFADITEPEDLVQEQALLGELLRGTRERYGIDKRYIRSDGQRIWVHVESRLVRDESGVPLYRISVIHDMADRHRAEKAMVMAEKISAANKLAAALAHEIVNSLMAIGNVFHLLEDDESLDPNSKELLALGEQELSHVDEITKRALMVTRGGGARVNVQFGELFDSMLDLYIASIRRAKVKIDRRYKIVEKAQIDVGVVKQVFTNLLTNALDAMSTGGNLRIHVYRSHSFSDESVQGVRIVLADTGGGISRDNMTRIFEPFFTTKGDRGTGLGLWVTRGVIVNSGGAIRVRSSQDPVRHGTCISVFLPCTFAEVPVAATSTM